MQHKSNQNQPSMLEEVRNRLVVVSRKLSELSKKGIITGDLFSALIDEQSYLSALQQKLIANMAHSENDVARTHGLAARLKAYTQSEEFAKLNVETESLCSACAYTRQCPMYKHIGAKAQKLCIFSRKHFFEFSFRKLTLGERRELFKVQLN